MVTILLAPSKTMDFISAPPYGVVSERPVFADKADRLVQVLQRQSSAGLKELMSVSEPIALAVHDFYAAWDIKKQGRPALWTYVGDVYKGMKATSLTLEDAQWAQRHLVIASGLYGLVRPFDGIQAYRLEMKAPIKIGSAKNLYEYWSDDLAKMIDATGTGWVCNCSSDEYAKGIVKRVSSPVVTPVFFDTKPNGTVGTVPIYSKMMRGVMARWMIDNRVSRPEELENFSAHEYRYDSKRSLPDKPAFSRLKMVPLQFS